MIFVLYHDREKTLKELSTKRIGFDKAAFIKTSHDLLPVLCQAWDVQWALIEAALTPAAGGAGGAGGVGGSVTAVAAAVSAEGAAGIVAVGVVCVKVRSYCEIKLTVSEIFPKNSVYCFSTAEMVQLLKAGALSPTLGFALETVEGAENTCTYQVLII